jgi:hypothetical protein
LAGATAKPAGGPTVLLAESTARMEKASGFSTSTTRTKAESGTAAAKRTEITVVAAMPFSPEERSQSAMVVMSPPEGPEIGVDSVGPNEPPAPLFASLREAERGRRRQSPATEYTCVTPGSDTLVNCTCPLTESAAVALSVAGNTAAQLHCSFVSRSASSNSIQKKDSRSTTRFEVFFGQGQT